MRHLGGPRHPRVDPPALIYCPSLPRRCNHPSSGSPSPWRLSRRDSVLPLDTLGVPHAPPTRHSVRPAVFPVNRVPNHCHGDSLRVRAAAHRSQVPTMVPVHRVGSTSPLKLHPDRLRVDLGSGAPGRLGSRRRPGRRSAGGTTPYGRTLLNSQLTPVSDSRVSESGRSGPHDGPL